MIGNSNYLFYTILYFNYIPKYYFELIFKKIY